MSSDGPSGLWPGFVDPVQNPQRVFRQIMQAMAHPGSREDLSLHYGAPNPGGPLELKPLLAAFVLALTLIDAQAGVWLSPRLRRSPLALNLRQHCGCRPTEQADRADFAFLTLAELQSLDGFRRGDALHLHRYTTLIGLCDSLQTLDADEAEGADQAGLVQIESGAGGSRRLRVGGLSPEQVALLQANGREAPLGHDVLLTSERWLVALPRRAGISATCAGHPSPRTDSLLRTAAGD